MDMTRNGKTISYNGSKSAFIRNALKETGGQETVALNMHQVSNWPRRLRISTSRWFSRQLFDEYFLFLAFRFLFALFISYSVFLFLHLTG